MNDMITTNYMTRMFQSYFKSTAVTGKTTQRSFLENIEQILEEKSVSAKEMTMEEYKRYIHDKIFQIPMNPSRMQDSISVQISEAGFEAMKNDPEYEKWVLGHLEKEFMAYNPWSAVCGGNYCVLHFGASPEEYRGESWYMGYKNGKGASLFNEKAKDSFWVRRAKNFKEIEQRYEMKRLQETMLEKRMEKNALFGQSKYFGAMGTYPLGGILDILGSSKSSKGFLGKS
ncbi:MAG: hypothetical protein J1E61_04890 [Lachnospiraceae bacterium]|nr:hypothetical protein [Lachnospiraceae bacterium]